MGRRYLKAAPLMRHAYVDNLNLLPPPVLDENALVLEFTCVTHRVGLQALGRSYKKLCSVHFSPQEQLYGWCRAARVRNQRENIQKPDIFKVWKP